MDACQQPGGIFYSLHGYPPSHPLQIIHIVETTTATQDGPPVPISSFSTSNIVVRIEKNTCFLHAQPVTNASTYLTAVH